MKKIEKNEKHLLTTFSEQDIITNVVNDTTL